MPTTDSRLGPGTLTFNDGTSHDFSTQVSMCKLVPSTNSEDGTPVLTDTTPNPTITVTWSIDFDVISDWGNDTGFVLWALDNANTSATFTFTPSTAIGNIFSGTCTVLPVEIGGDVYKQSIVSASFPLDNGSAPTWTD